MARYVQLYEPLFPNNLLGAHSDPVPLHVNADAVEFVVASESRRYCSDLHLTSGAVVTVQGVVAHIAWRLRQGPVSRRWDRSQTSVYVRRMRHRIENRRYVNVRGQTGEEVAS